MLHHTASDASCCFSLYGYLCQGICSHQVMLFIVTRQCNHKFTNSGNLSIATSSGELDVAADSFWLWKYIYREDEFTNGNISTTKTNSPAMEIHLPRRRVHQQLKYIYGDDEFTNNGNISTTTTILPTIQIYLPWRRVHQQRKNLRSALSGNNPTTRRWAHQKWKSLHENDMLTSYGNLFTAWAIAGR